MRPGTRAHCCISQLAIIPVVEGTVDLERHSPDIKEVAWVHPASLGREAGWCSF